MSSVMKSTEVNLPVSVIYNQWTQFEEFPHFMDGVEEVQQIDDRNLHWKAKIGGTTEEWNAEISEQIPDKRIAWHSTSGAKNAGVVTFHRIADDRSRVTLQLDYEPATWSETLGELLGFLERRVESDLESFKKFIEGRQHETGAWRGQVAAPGERA